MSFKTVKILPSLLLLVTLTACNTYPDCENDPDFLLVKEKILDQIQAKARASRPFSLAFNDSDTISISAIKEVGMDDEGPLSDDWTCTCFAEFDYGNAWGEVYYSVRKSEDNYSTKVNSILVQPVSREMYEKIKNKAKD